MHFDDESFEIRIENTDEIVTSQKELVQSVIMNGLLDDLMADGEE